MPVYNEEKAIGAVLDKWVKAMDQLGIAYTINPYNDGSKDDSLKVIQEKADEYSGKVIPHTKPNGGHGPTILQGYKEAAATGYTWVFQIDSDDEMGPEGFPELWNNREKFDFLVGIRDGRKQAMPRKIISAVSRMSVRLFYEKSIWDVNTPYRLMRVSAFKDIWEAIPSNTFAPNVIISGMAGYKKLRCYETRVPQRDRQTGEVSIKKWKLLKAAARSFWQTITFSIKNANFFYPISFLLSTLFFSSMINFTPFAVKPIQSTDSEVFFTIGRAIHNGLVPYRDIFDHKGPLIYFIDALGGLCGFRGIGIIEILFWLCFLLILAKIWKLLKIDIFIFSIIVVLLPLIIEPILAGGNLVEVYSLPFIAFGNLYLLKLCLNNEVKKLDSFLLGIFAAATLCLRANMIAVFLIDGLALLYILLVKGRKWLSFMKVFILGLCGVGLVLIPIYIYFYCSNALQDMFFCTWKFNLLYSANNSSFFHSCAQIVKRFISNYYTFIPFLILTLIFFDLRFFHKRHKTYITLYSFLILDELFSSYTCLFSRSIWEHYFLTMIPIFVISFGIFISTINLKLSQYTFFLLFLGIVLLNLGMTQKYLSKHIISLNESVELKEVIQYFSSQSPEYRKKTLVLGNNCNLYRKLNLTPSFKYIYQEPIIRFSSIIKDNIFQSLIQQNYEYILDPVNDERFNINNNPDHIVQELYKIISCFYTPVFSNKNFIIYRKKNL